MKVIGVWWFNDIGIVAIKNDISQNKAYIKKIAGNDDIHDTKDIIANGSPVHLSQAIEIVQALTHGG